MKKPTSLIGLFLIWIAGALTSCQQECPPPSGEVTPEAMAVIEENVAAYNAHDVDKVMSLFTDDCVIIDITGERWSLERQRSYLEGLFRGYPDFTVVFKPGGFQVGNQVVAYYTMSGTNTDISWNDQPPTNTAFKDIVGVLILELKDGKIAHQRNFNDGVSLFTQMGYAITRPDQLEASVEE